MNVLDSIGSLRSLTAGPWIYAAVATSVLLDVFLPVLPSGVLVIVALARGGGLLVVIARFAPAGRSVVSLGAGAARRRIVEFLPWSALAGVAWAGYSVALGWFGGLWLGATWIGAGVSILALFLAGALAAYVIRRPAAAPAPAS